MDHRTQPDPPTAIESFPTAPVGLAEAGPELVELASGDTWYHPHIREDDTRHIAEHMQSGMMFSFTVARSPEAAR